MRRSPFRAGGAAAYRRRRRFADRLADRSAQREHEPEASTSAAAVPATRGNVQSQKRDDFEGARAIRAPMIRWTRMASAEIVLSAENLTKRFGDREAVSDVSFDVRAGEVFGFLGPNGAGKTTTIRMLVGLARPDRGSVRIRGLDIARHSRGRWRTWAASSSRRISTAT